ncbi:MAG: dienelactone hydrolase family protein [Planctomycetota bacterium]
MSRNMLWGIASGLSLALVGVAGAAAIQAEPFVYGTVEGKPVEGYLAKPDTPGPHPGIILIHEWWGLNDAIRATARQFAELGYVALAVDLYGEEATTDRDVARKYATGVQQNMDAAFENLKAAVKTLKEMPDVDPDRLASIGWCFGGGWSYQMAKNNLGVKATVIYYGRFNPEDDLQIMRAKIIGHFAEEDRGIHVDNVKEFQATLKTLGGDHEIYIYPNTQHGFASRPGENPNYDEQSAQLAWERTQQFLTKVLGDPQPEN